MTIRKYYELLKNHDRYFMMDEDFSKVNKGQGEQELMLKEAQADPLLGAMYDLWMDAKYDELREFMEGQL